ncbi:MAG: aldo/keto reductase, partial [Acidobacteriota bacterium]
MEYVRLGRSSLRVSRIAFGAMGIGDPGWRSWVLTEEQARPLVRRALEAGITLFDTCDYYS